MRLFISRQFKHLLKTVVLIGAAAPALAQEAPETVDEGENSPTTEEEPPGNKRSWAVLPGAFYSQETSVGFAALGMYTFALPGAGEATWPSSATGTVVYTVRNQASLSLWTGFYWGEANDWLVESESFMEHFPTNYYGIGATSEPSYELYTRRQISVNLTGRRRVRGPVYLGVATRFSALDILDIQDPVQPDGSEPVVWTADDQLASGNVTGGDGTRTAGVGALARWDTRDNVQSTKSGGLIDLETTAYPTFLSTKHPFTLSTLDMRGFLPVGNGVLAGQWLTQLGTSDMPFSQMPELGGDNQLRGMFQGRYRDRNATSVQVELRYPIYWRFGASAFAGVGQVAPTPTALLKQAPRWTAGGGLRFELDEDAHTNIRLDFGKGPDGGGLIFTFGEAF